MIAIPAVAIATKIKIAAIAAATVFLVSACMLRDASLRSQGAEKAVAKIEKANTNAVKKGTRAAERSRDPGVRGPIDPTTRD